MAGPQTTEFIVWLVAVFGGIAVFTGLLTALALKVRRAADAASVAMRAGTVKAECDALLLGPEFLWGVWHDTAGAAALHMRIRDAHDAEITTVSRLTLPLDGVLRHFDLDGRHYEIRKSGLMSRRTVLREAGREDVLLSAEHHTARVEIFRGDGEKPLCEVPQTSVFHRFRPVNFAGAPGGRIIVGLKGNAYAAVMTLPDGQCTLLEKVFLLASL